MAGASLFTLLDDIASVLDDVSILTKLAAKKTAGVLGDDLALNAQQVTGVKADRELPVVWAVAKGSLVNKAILVPAALAISAFAPWLVTPLLMVGGAFLCYEGFEKLAHKLLHAPGDDDSEHARLTHALTDPTIDHNDPIDSLFADFTGTEGQWGGGRWPYFFLFNAQLLQNNATKFDCRFKSFTNHIINIMFHQM